MRLLRLAGLLVPVLTVALAVPASAKETQLRSARPKLLIHGHYCGPGNDVRIPAGIVAQGSDMLMCRDGLAALQP